MLVNLERSHSIRKGCYRRHNVIVGRLTAVLERTTVSILFADNDGDGQIDEDCCGSPPVTRPPTRPPTTRDPDVCLVSSKLVHFCLIMLMNRRLCDLI